MTAYRVRWEMEIEAGSEREAAEKALAIQRDPESIAVFFTVSLARGIGRNISVDLLDEAPATFLITYNHCGQTWEETWSCACNDKCPKCGKEIEPSEYREVTQ